MGNRVITNPIIKDKVTFIKTAAETNGKLTWITIELAPKGGNELHYHENFTETFEPIRGELGLTLGKKELILKEGESKTVPVNAIHRFYNPNDFPIEFHVKIEPGSRNLEAFLQIIYGLAKDGKTNRKSIPTNLWVLGALSGISETLPPKNTFLAKLKFFANWLEKQAEKRNVLAKLRREYVRF